MESSGQKQNQYGETSVNLMNQLGLLCYATTEDEPYMNDNQLNHFQSYLNAWKNHLLSTSELTAGQIQNDITSIPDANDRASYESTLGHLLHRNGRERKLVKRIEKSLIEIQNKNYGFCKSCQAHIGLKRLEARPIANECIDCKSLSEDAEKA